MVPADLFIELWTTLSGLKISDPPADDRLIVSATRLLGNGSEPELSKLRSWVGGKSDRVLAAAQAIDKWYEPFAVSGGSIARLNSAHMASLQKYLVDARLDSGGTDGRVILRRPFWGIWQDAAKELPIADHPGEWFDHLAYLPSRIAATHPDTAAPTDVTLVFKMFPTDARSLPSRWLLGFAPLAQAKADIHLEEVPHAGREWYDAQVVDLTSRLEAVVVKLINEGCHIIALPEMVMHPKAKAALRRIVRRHGPSSELVMIFAGSGPTSIGKMPFNECEILNHYGDVVVTQRKLSRWNLDDTACTRFDLKKGIGGYRFEFIEVGEEITVVDYPGIGRIAALICEDLTRDQPGRWVRNNLVLDLQFTPVLDSSLDLNKWEVKNGSKASLAGGCRVIVSNSFPLTHRQNEVNSKTGAFPPVVNCGIGLAIEKVGPKVHGILKELPLAGTDDATAILDWDSKTWKTL